MTQFVNCDSPADDGFIVVAIVKETDKLPDYIDCPTCGQSRMARERHTPDCLAYSCPNCGAMAAFEAGYAADKTIIGRIIAEKPLA